MHTAGESTVIICNFTVKSIFEVELFQASTCSSVDVSGKAVILKTFFAKSNLRIQEERRPSTSLSGLCGWVPSHCL